MHPDTSRKVRNGSKVRSTRILQLNKLSGTQSAASTISQSHKHTLNCGVFMHHKDLFFVIPTYRLRDVGETIQAYDEHFWRNGHAPKIIVFDDSSPVAQEKYYPILEQTRTHNDVYYVGPKEKEQFTAYLSSRLRD